MNLFKTVSKLVHEGIRVMVIEHMSDSGSVIAGRVYVAVVPAATV